MSKFEVGKKYKGWCRDCWTTPATLIVVSIAEDRKTLLAVSEKGSDPKRAFTYKVRWDDRFGEKIVTGERGLYNVWRADKVAGDAEIPEDWYSDKKRSREDGARKAAETRATKAKLQKMVGSIDIAKFLEIFFRLERWESDRVWNGVAFNAETLSKYLKVWNGKLWRSSKGWCIHVRVSGTIPCDTYIDRWENREKNSLSPNWGFDIYADKIRGKYCTSQHIEGEEFKAFSARLFNTKKGIIQ